MAEARGAHLVGSVPLRDTEAVLRAAGTHLGSRLRRVPDGETGIRTLWDVWQYPVLARNPAFVAPVARHLTHVLVLYSRFRLARRIINALVAHAMRAERSADRNLIRLRPGIGAEDIWLDPLGYSTIARMSYAVFARLKRVGDLPAHLRFQVSLPTPLAPLTSMPVAQRLTTEPAYQRAMLDEVAAICATIPHTELAVQWDTTVEFAMLEDAMPGLGVARPTPSAQSSIG